MSLLEANAALVEAVLDAFSEAPIERAQQRRARSPVEPWHAWLLAALVRQLWRQAWMVKVIEEHGLRELGGRGEIPGLPGHHFWFHGMGCCFTLPYGEVLDVDFWDDDGLTIDPHFFARRLWSIAQPAVVEAHVRDLLPSEKLCVLALKQLQAKRLLWHDASEHVFRLPRQLETLAPAAPDFAREETRALWFHHLGDFEAPLLSAHMRAAGLSAYRAYLLRCLETEATALTPLIDCVPREVLLKAVEAILAGPITPHTGALVETLELHSLPISSALLNVAARLDPSEHYPYPALAVICSLFRRKLEVELATRLLLSFARIERVPGFSGNPFLGSFAVLALEYAPRHALALLRRALRSNIPIVRLEAASALVVLAHPWCIDELTQALADPSTSGHNAELREALSLLTDERGAESPMLYLSIDSLRPRLGALRDALKERASVEGEL